MMNYRTCDRSRFDSCPYNSSLSFRNLLKSKTDDGICQIWWAQAYAINHDIMIPLPGHHTHFIRVHIGQTIHISLSVLYILSLQTSRSAVGFGGAL